MARRRYDPFRNERQRRQSGRNRITEKCWRFKISVRHRRMREGLQIGAAIAGVRRASAATILCPLFRIEQTDTHRLGCCGKKNPEADHQNGGREVAHLFDSYLCLSGMSRLYS